MTERPTTTWERVTPDIAAQWLDHNTNNRHLSERTVTRYVSDMSAGRWVRTGDPVRFTRDGRLIDGQHRLTALVRSGMSFDMLIIRGLDDEAQGAMDQGKARSASDVLTLRGEKNATTIAAAARQWIMWHDGFLFRDNRRQSEITNAVIAEWVASHRAAITALQENVANIRNNDAPTSVSGAAFIGFWSISPEDAVEFFDLLANGAGGQGHPIVTLDKRLQRMRREGLKMTNRDYLAMFIQSWNAWRQGREMSKFQRPRGGVWSADNFPIPR